jgi:dTDP-4-dehydrorhamnose 3,5-epimerase
MNYIATNLNGLYVIEPKVFGDHRGYFLESFRQDLFDKLETNLKFVQDNQSKSAKNILRGLHFQRAPKSQGKLVQVIKGAVLDVVVDIRKESSTFGQHFSIELNEKNKKLLWIPPGFAHGFLTLEDETIFSYKCTDYYAPELEGSIRWNDETLNIQWGIDIPILSEKDKNAPLFSNLGDYF